MKRLLSPGTVPTSLHAGGSLHGRDRKTPRRGCPGTHGCGDDRLYPVQGDQLPNIRAVPGDVMFPRIHPTWALISCCHGDVFPHLCYYSLPLSFGLGRDPKALVYFLPPPPPPPAILLLLLLGPLLWKAFMMTYRKTLFR